MIEIFRALRYDKGFPIAMDLRVHSSLSVFIER